MANVPNGFSGDGTSANHIAVATNSAGDHEIVFGSNAAGNWLIELSVLEAWSSNPNLVAGFQLFDEATDLVTKSGAAHAYNVDHSTISLANQDKLWSVSTPQITTVAANETLSLWMQHNGNVTEQTTSAINGTNNLSWVLELRFTRWA